MNIERVKIENFKCFKSFSLDFSEGVNIIVGANESGKSTVLEAIHLGLSGLLNGRYLHHELTQYIFNLESVQEYLSSLKSEEIETLTPPRILIEIFFAGEEMALFEGDCNSTKQKASGISVEVAFNDDYKAEYEELISNSELSTLPIEYYEISWTSFAREKVSTRRLPIKSALIDSTSSRFQNGSDVYISRIIKENLELQEIVDISQSYRKMKETFMAEDAILAINERIKTAATISDKDVKLSVDLSSRNAWETSLMTYLDDIPFHHIGKGEQCVVKTNLALGHRKAKEVNLILMEEPENHLSHSKLNELIRSIGDKLDGRQLLISTHSSFVANKLGLDGLILLNNHNTVRLSDLAPGTESYFKKLAGYDTLRLILCKKAILVEGDSDELVVQKAYMQENEGRLPIQDGVDVISVGLSFLRFLEIAKRLQIPTVVVTDNDGNLEAINRKYNEYLDDTEYPWIKICFDETIDTGDLLIGENHFNYNTLEPKLLKQNRLGLLNAIFNKNIETEDEMHKYMRSNKTDCALAIFESTEEIEYPEYIREAIN